MLIFYGFRCWVKWCIHFHSLETELKVCVCVLVVGGKFYIKLNTFSVSLA